MKQNHEKTITALNFLDLKEVSFFGRFKKKPKTPPLFEGKTPSAVFERRVLGATTTRGKRYFWQLCGTKPSTCLRELAAHHSNTSRAVTLRPEPIPALQRPLSAARSSSLSASPRSTEGTSTPTSWRCADKCSATPNTCWLIAN